MKKLNSKIAAVTAALLAASSLACTAGSVSAVETIPEVQTVSMLGQYAETDLVEYLSDNSITLENDDVITVQEEDGVKSLQVAHVVSQIGDTKVVEYSTLLAYDQDENGNYELTDVSVSANPNARTTHSIEFEPNNYDITVTGYAVFTTRSTLLNTYCAPTSVAFKYTENSGDVGDVNEIDVGIICSGALCDSSYNVIEDGFDFEITKGVQNPISGRRYSATGSVSQYGGTWVLIESNMMTGGFTMTFQVYDGDHWDATTRNINFW